MVGLDKFPFNGEEVVEVVEVAEVAAMDRGVLSLSIPWDISRVTMAWEREE